MNTETLNHSNILKIVNRFGSERYSLELNHKNGLDQTPTLGQQSILLFKQLSKGYVPFSKHKIYISYEIVALCTLQCCQQMSTLIL